MQQQIKNSKYSKQRKKKQIKKNNTNFLIEFFVLTTIALHITIKKKVK